MTEPRVKEYRYQGINIQLISAPGLQQASACVRSAVGSHHEPAAWPGLAHLLEHLLFQGGTRFGDDQRLMPWVSRHHGRVNATTEACQTLYYFEVSQAYLSAGIARLLDMVLSPCLETASISREIAVIDAEYELLTGHLPTLCQAFLADGFSGAEEYRRFVVGNRQSLGGDPQAVRQALYTFHQRGYQPENLTLTVRADLPLATLQQQVRHAFDLGGNGEKTPQPVTLTDAAQQNNSPLAGRDLSKLALPTVKERRPVVLHATGERQHLLSYLIDDPEGDLADTVPLLQALISDASPGSLRHYWTTAGLCHDLQVEQISAQRGRVWLLIRLTSAPGKPQPAGLLHASWQAWLRQLMQLTDSQRVHYRKLADRHLASVSPMEQLRKLASGQGGQADSVASLAASLLTTPYRELQTGLFDGGEIAHVRGFPCRWQPAEPATQPLTPPPQPFIFYPALATVDDIGGRSSLRPNSSPVCWRADHGGQQVALVMRPPIGTTLTVGQYGALQRSLAPFFSRVHHAGGRAALSQWQGVPWLNMNLPDSGQAEALLALLIRCWSDSDHSLAEDGQEILIRRLLARFPALLAETFKQPRWCALLQCQDDSLFHQLDQKLQQGIPQLSRHQPRQQPLPPGLGQHHPAREGDSALLFFLPVDHHNAEQLAAAQVLGSLYQPAFYQWLREERSVGYVVSCRFERLADRAGILCALQSPHWDHQQLRTACETFFDRITEKVVSLTEVPELPQHCDSGADALLRQALWQKISGEGASPQDETTLSRLSLIKLHRHFCQQARYAVRLSYGR